MVAVVVASEEEGGGGATGEPSECEIRGIPGIHCNGCLPPKLDSEGMTNPREASTRRDGSHRVRLLLLVVEE